MSPVAICLSRIRLSAKTYTEDYTLRCSSAIAAAGTRTNRDKLSTVFVRIILYPRDNYACITRANGDGSLLWFYLRIFRCLFVCVLLWICLCMCLIDYHDSTRLKTEITLFWPLFKSFSETTNTIVYSRADYCGYNRQSRNSKKKRKTLKRIRQVCLLCPRVHIIQPCYPRIRYYRSVV